MVGSLFQRRLARRLFHAGRMVCHAEQAMVESAGVDTRSGMVGALYDDGGGGVAGVEAWRIRRQRRPLALFFTQLVLNAAWTPLFFGLHWPGVAFAEITLLWMAIAATLVVFRNASRPAAWLLAPYLAWVSFGAALNFALWRLNSCELKKPGVPTRAAFDENLTHYKQQIPALLWFNATLK